MGQSSTTEAPKPTNAPDKEETKVKEGNLDGGTVQSNDPFWSWYGDFWGQGGADGETTDGSGEGEDNVPAMLEEYNSGSSAEATEGGSIGSGEGEDNVPPMLEEYNSGNSAEATEGGTGSGAKATGSEEDKGDVPPVPEGTIGEAGSGEGKDYVEPVHQDLYKVRIACVKFQDKNKGYFVHTWR